MPHIKLNNPYLKLASQVQSRIAKRSNSLRKKEEWRTVYKALRQFDDFDKMNLKLKDLKASQVLDKVLYGVMLDDALQWEDQYGPLTDKSDDKFWGVM